MALCFTAALGIGLFTLSPLVIIAQDSAQPLVAFVVDSDLQTASLTDLGPTGLSRLAEIFRGLGARVDYIDLDGAIPEDVEVLVLARPIKSFTVPQVVRLWIYIQQGKNLLLSLDPEGQYLGFANINTQVSRSGLTALMTSEYGISIKDTFFVEPWFTTETITSLDATYSRVFPDIVSHPVTAPLVAHQVPVWMWGMRNLNIEFIGIDSRAVPLLYSNHGYGESDVGIFRRLRGANNYTAPSAPLEVNIGVDSQGWLNFAALGENSASASRVMIVGDSEVIQNAYGLATQGALARYPGNLIFAQRAAAWLLELPPGQWPPLPEGFTWVAVDGSARDWTSTATVVLDTSDPALVANSAYDIQQVRAFEDDIYTYVLIETADLPDGQANISLQLDENQDGEVDHTIFAQQGNVTSRDELYVTMIDDAQVAVAAAIELRLPRRTVSTTIANVCLSSSDLSSADCLDQAVLSAEVETRAPVDVSLVGGQVVTVNASTDVNLRAGPGTNTPILTTIPSGTAFAPIGRNTDATWIKVQNAAYTGWLSETLIIANGDFDSLPVVEA